LQVEGRAWEFIRTFDNPLTLARRCIEWAVQKKISVLTVALCEAAILVFGTEAEQVALVKGELANKTLQEFINSIAVLNVIDPKTICLAIEKLWHKGILPLHEFDVRYYIEFISNKTMQGLYD
jgi:hypothetical protein